MTQRDWLTREQVKLAAQVYRELCGDPGRSSFADGLEAMALAYLDAQEWRPIADAPKDGTPILVYTGGTDITTAQWRHDSWNLIEWGSFADDALCYPTHWRPLPAPPQQKERPE